MILKKTLSFIGLFSLLLTPILFSGCGNSSTNAPKYRLSLEVWGVFDDSDAFRIINAEFPKYNPAVVEVKYKKISSNALEYEKELFDAIAAGNGPDVFFFNNTWLTKHKNKIAPFPGSKDFIKIFKENFIDAASEDFIADENIYAQPLYCDTLGLFYNKDILNQAGITTPAKTWEEIMKNTKQLTKIDNYGNITQSAIAFGRSANGQGAINRAPDILTLLMLQGGASMTDARGLAQFDQGGINSVSPGLSALQFYTQFSNAESSVYTWNAKMDYSIDSFRTLKTAMMLNYSYMYPRLKSMDPKLNIGVALVPQLNPENKINFASYWGLAVNKNKELKSIDPANPKVNFTNEDRIKEAWRFVQFVTMKPSSWGTSNVQTQTPTTSGVVPNMPAVQNQAFDGTKEYLNNTKKPAARRDLIDLQKSDPILGVFAEQALTAKSWTQPDNLIVEEIFNNMIDDVTNGRAVATEALRLAASRINALLQKKL